LFGLDVELERQRATGEIQMGNARRIRSVGENFDVGVIDKLAGGKY
jgi:hypothetical protein